MTIVKGMVAVGLALQVIAMVLSGMWLGAFAVTVCVAAGTVALITESHDERIRAETAAYARGYGDGSRRREQARTTRKRAGA